MRKSFPAQVLADLGLNATAPRGLTSGAATAPRGRRKRAAKADHAAARANQLLDRVSVALQPGLDDFDAAWE